MPDTARMDADYNYARALHLNAMIGRLPCPNCGAADGMEEWLPATVYALEISDTGVIERDGWIVVGVKFYIRRDRHDVLFASCGQCRADGSVPKGYKELTPAQVERWLQAQSKEA